MNKIAEAPQVVHNGLAVGKIVNIKNITITVSCSAYPRPMLWSFFLWGKYEKRCMVKKKDKTKEQFFEYYLEYING